MEINSANATFSPPTPEIARDDSVSAISSDFETFIRMLTVQMQNQDPLNPINSTDYATQLATFSGVEQQVRTNDLLQGLGAQLGASGLSQYAGWVGMDARVTGPVNFDGQPITIYPDIAANANAATLVVTNQAGQEISRQSIATDGEPIDWAGTDGNGQPLAPGNYTFSVVSVENGGVGTTSPAQTYARINEVRFNAGGMIAVLQGGIEIAAENVTALRAPDS